MIDLTYHQWKRIEQIGAVASKDRHRDVLQAIYVEPTDNGLAVTATDSYRLATTTIEASANGDDPLLIPAKAVKDIRVAAGKLPDVSDSTRLTITADGQFFISVALFDVDGEELFRQRVRLVEGKFPKYRALFPADDEGLEGLSKADLVKAIQNADPEFQPHSKQTKADLLSIAQRVRVGVAAAVFNPALITGLMASAGPDAENTGIEARFRGHLKPIVFRSHGDREWRGLLMPVRVP